MGAWLATALSRSQERFSGQGSDSSCRRFTACTTPLWSFMALLRMPLSCPCWLIMSSLYFRLLRSRKSGADPFRLRFCNSWFAGTCGSKCQVLSFSRFHFPVSPLAELLFCVAFRLSPFAAPFRRHFRATSSAPDTSGPRSEPGHLGSHLPISLSLVSSTVILSSGVPGR